jgi:hypothetical protein
MYTVSLLLLYYFFIVPSDGFANPFIAQSAKKNG